MKNTLVTKTLLGYRKARPGETSPRPIWLAQGGSEGADVDGGGDGTDDDVDAADEEEGEDEEEKGKGSKASGEKTVPEAKYLQIKNHLSKADARSAKLEAELKALKTKDLPETEKLKADHEEAVKAAETYRAKYEKTARTNAFLRASGDLKITWQNSTAALKLAELEDLEINDDGSVDGIEGAVKALAKDHPYLLAPKDSEEDGKSTPPAKSGSVVGSKNRGKKTEKDFDDEELRRRFQALR